ncbi:unnamed protein product [Paramecium primaurelia]|uniref:Tubulin-tyrosine ligase n=1 Tax=Paramecium primaurelia TaxID=5886 RepID=A0A8S1NRA2_PARPR|nr:unnamed protein product [Paramecium primaurelia]
MIQYIYQYHSFSIYLFLLQKINNKCLHSYRYTFKVQLLNIQLKSNVRIANLRLKQLIIQFDSKKFAQTINSNFFISLIFYFTLLCCSWKQQQTYYFSNPRKKKNELQILLSQLIINLNYKSCNLIRNLKQFCQTNKKYVGDIIPLSFIIEINAQENNLNRVLKEFTLAYEQFQPLSFMKTLINYFTKHNSQYFLPKMHHRFLDEENNYIWQLIRFIIKILKPNEFNRGRGIQFFRTIEELKSLLKNFNKGTSEYQFSQGQIKSSSFMEENLIQEFGFQILIHQRYLFLIKVQRDYHQICLIQITEMHLFIQQIMQKLDVIFRIELLTNGEFTKTVLPKIKSIIVLTWMAVQNTFKKCKYSFEIFGYDFMLDEQLKPWLIEINTNPYLEESSQLLKELIPKMIDDAIKILIDPLFTKINESTSLEHLLQL